MPTPAIFMQSVAHHKLFRKHLSGRMKKTQGRIYWLFVNLITRRLYASLVSKDNSFLPSWLQLLHRMMWLENRLYARAGDIIIVQT